jgi:homoprotocatechuate degradation regulator HpaR
MQQGTIVSQHQGTALQEQIPQDTRRSLPIALLRAREAVMAGFRPLLARHGVTEQQWRVLRILSEVGEPIDASNLASRAFILPPSLTRIVKVLGERGLIDCTRDPIDGRRILIGITDSGKRLIQTVAPESREVYVELEKRYGADRIAALLDMLDDLTTKLTR